MPDEIRGGFNAKVFKRFPGRLFVMIGHEDRVICNYEVFNSRGEKIQDLNPKFQRRNICNPDNATTFQHSKTKMQYLVFAYEHYSRT